MADCVRCDSRPAPTGPRRPEGRLAAYCDHCRQNARKRLRLRGVEVPTDAETLAELRRPGTRGPKPGARG